MESSILLILLLVILTVHFVTGRVLEFLNLRSLRSDLPEEVSAFYDPEHYKRSTAYARTNIRFGFLTSTLSFALMFTVLSLGWFGRLDIWIRSFQYSESVTSLLFFGFLFIGSDLLQIPFQVYDTFVIEERYGFNKTSPRTFITDKLKGYLLALLIGGPLLLLFLWLAGSFGPSFWIYFWVVSGLFTLFMTIFYTSLILPLFNKLKPLDAGELRDALEDFGRRAGFPMKNIYVMDGSKRSSKSNAFFSGLGKRKKIVLFDTLVEKHSVPELVAVLAHEVGHYVKKHVLVSYLIGLLQSGFILFLLSRMLFSPALSEALGAQQSGLHLNLLAFGILFSPVSQLLGIAANLLSRRNEFEADAYAAKTAGSDAMASALKKLSVDNLSNLYPHPAYVFFHYSHPPLLARLDALKV